jgi:hypothetical protein
MLVAKNQYAPRGFYNFRNSGTALIIGQPQGDEKYKYFKITAIIWFLNGK